MAGQTIQLLGGYKMPLVGLGTYKVSLNLFLPKVYTKNRLKNVNCKHFPKIWHLNFLNSTIYLKKITSFYIVIHSRVS